MHDEKKLKELAKMLSEWLESGDPALKSLGILTHMLSLFDDEISPEEKEIMERIKATLDTNGLTYIYDEDKPKDLVIGATNDTDITVAINVFLQNGKVILRLSFPFKVQTNAIPLLSMYMAEFNKNKAYTILGLDPYDGEVFMHYTDALSDPKLFDETAFFTCVMTFISVAFDIYTKLAGLSMGVVSDSEHAKYKKLLELSLDTLNGDFDDTNITYGTEDLSPGEDDE